MIDRIFEIKQQMGISAWTRDGEERMKTRIRRCQSCKKHTLIDISREPEKINPFTYRSYSGVQCTSCNWSKKTYTFKDVVEEKG